MAWPAFFPYGCPPKDTAPATGEIFIFASSDKPIEESFTCKKVRFPEDRDSEECLRCGLSVSRCWTDCEESRRRVHSLRRKKLYFTCLEEAVGEIKHTPIQLIEKHYTWWLPEGFEKPWECFEEW